MTTFLSSPIVLVGLGGGLGAVLRYLLSSRIAGTNWPEKPLAGPLSILVVNLLGCLAFGLLQAWAKARPEAQAALFLLTGILGGFTTFSTFSWDTYALACQGRWGWVAMNVLVSVIGGVLAVAVGVKCAGSAGYSG